MHLLRQLTHSVCVLGGGGGWGGGQEIKPSNKTKAEMAKGSPLGVIIPPCASELIREVETDVADSGAQLGSVAPGC